MEENHKHSGDENAKDSGDNGYTFVQERILKRRSRMFRLFIRLFWNVFIPVCACVIVCFIFYFKFMGDEPVVPEETGTENGIIINDETGTSNEETTTGGDKDKIDNDNLGNDNLDSDNLDGEENLVKLEEIIKKMVVVVSVVREDKEKKESKSELPVEKHTGVVVSMYGPVYILLQYDNIKDYKEIYVHIGENIILETTVYDIDYATGLALLKIEKSKVTEEVRNSLSVAAFRNENKIMEGTGIVYCGNVVGNGPMLMKGHISNSSNEVSSIDLNYNIIMTDIMFDKAKDGFLFNSKGNLVGIVGLSSDKLQLPSVVAGASAMDMTYIINNMLNEKKDIYFGITGQKVSPKIEEIAGGTMPKGIYVSSVRVDSPAYNAGIMAGDIIYMIDKVNEPDMESFGKCIQDKAKGDTVKVGVKRKIGNDYNVYTMKVILDTRD